MAKICDFGCAVFEPREFRKTLCGTPLYLSPEVLQGRRYNSKIDIWALGTLAYEIFTNKNPFKIESKEELSKIITMDF
jgi:serine/threonine protein kinase